jgi:virginiamycin A acetyltransferase
MFQILKKIGRQLIIKKYRTHPNITNSLMADLSQVHSSARINKSTCYGNVKIEQNCVLDECEITANSQVSIGAYSILTGPIRIVADINPVSIGKFCSLAPHVIIWESLHDTKRITSYFILSEFFGESFKSDIVSKGPVKIGNDVWIGARSVILSGVSIGDGAVIGAGSVVTRDIPPFSIAGGIPAAVLKPRFPEQICRRLIDLRWWDWEEDKIKRNRKLFDEQLSMDLLDRII